MDIWGNSEVATLVFLYIFSYGRQGSAFVSYILVGYLGVEKKD